MVQTIANIVGSNLSLCAIRTDDDAICAYTRWMNDMTINKFLSHNNIITQLAEEKKYITKDRDALDHNWNIVVNGKNKETDGMLIGVCGLTLGKSLRSAELGILIGEHEYLSRGYGTEVVGLMLWYAFQQMDMHEVHLGVMADNERALRCYEKNGFRICGTYRERYYYDGAYRDGHVMQILRSEWDSYRSIKSIQNNAKP